MSAVKLVYLFFSVLVYFLVSYFVMKFVSRDNVPKRPCKSSTKKITVFKVGVSTLAVRNNLEVENRIKAVNRRNGKMLAYFSSNRPTVDPCYISASGLGSGIVNLGKKMCTC